MQFLACIPLLFFIKRPNGMFYITLWGFTAGIGQYALQIKGLELGVSPGIASVILQLQAFFTPVLLTVILGYKFYAHMIYPLALGFLGVYFINSTDGENNFTNTVAITLLILASLFWSVGNVVITRMKQRYHANNDILSIVVYAGAINSIPVTVWMCFEQSFVVGQLAELSFIQVVYIIGLFLWVLLAYLGGYYIWNMLIVKHGGAKIVRYSLLVPIFGIALSYLVYENHISHIQMLGVVVILAALSLNHYLDEKFAVSNEN